MKNIVIVCLAFLSCIGCGMSREQYEAELDARMEVHYAEWEAEYAQCNYCVTKPNNKVCATRCADDWWDEDRSPPSEDVCMELEGGQIRSIGDAQDRRTCFEREMREDRRIRNWRKYCALLRTEPGRGSIEDRKRCGL